MPAIVQDFDPQNIGEIVLFTMDFSLNMQSGETINSVTWNATIIAGTGSDSLTTRPIGTTAIAGQAVTGLIDFQQGTISNNAEYLITATVATSLGQRLIGYGHCTVTNPS